MVRYRLPPQIPLGQINYFVLICLLQNQKEQISLEYVGLYSDRYNDVKNYRLPPQTSRLCRINYFILVTISRNGEMHKRILLQIILCQRITQDDEGLEYEKVRK